MLAPNAERSSPIEPIAATTLSPDRAIPEFAAAARIRRPRGARLLLLVMAALGGWLLVFAIGYGFASLF